MMKWKRLKYKKPEHFQRCLVATSIGDDAMEFLDFFVATYDDLEGMWDIYIYPPTRSGVPSIHINCKARPSHQFWSEIDFDGVTNGSS